MRNSRGSSKGICLIDKDGFVLIVHENSDTNKYGFPKGHSLYCSKYSCKERRFTTAVRELREETGIELNSYNYKKCKTYENPLVIYEVRLNISYKDINIKKDEKEISSVFWMPFKWLVEDYMINPKIFNNSVKTVMDNYFCSSTSSCK